jgi:D-alanyl-D-alanine carboxypeptidase (penicillin-binding protein 5/6)
VTYRPRRVTATVAALGAALAAGAGAAGAAAAPGDPDVESAAAAIVVDAADGAVMFRRHAGKRRAMASTTKLMTALLALERARPRDVFTAPPYDALPQESKIDLRAGERMRVADLLEALLLESANDAAVTIAQGVSGSRPAFVADMNERASQLGLRGTHYANPIGLDDPGNYSTARDLARLARRLLRNRRFARVVDMPEAVLQSGAHRRVVENRNDLVARFPFVDGVKTGHTLRAGYVLVGTGHGAGGARVVTVVMGEPGEAARDADTLALLRWGLSRFHRVRAVDRRRAVARVPVEDRDEPAALVPRRTVVVTARRDQRVERRVSAPARLEGPLPAGRRVGAVTILRDGRRVRTVALVTAHAVPGPGALRKALDAIGLPLLVLLALGTVAGAVVLVQRLRGRLRLVRER